MMTSKWSIACAGVMLVLLSGCAVYHARPISPEQAAAGIESRSLAGIHVKEFLEKNLRHQIAPWPPARWDFAMLAQAAYYYHPDIDVARGEFEIARATMVTAGERPNPAFTVAPEFVSNAAAGVSPWILGIFPDIPIETAGKRGYRIARASHLADAARLNIATVAWQVRSRLRTALVNLYVSDRKETIYQELLRVQEDYVKMLVQRLEDGYISLPELTLARISLARSRLSLKEVQQQIAQNRVKLAEAVGVPASALVGIDISFGFVEELPARMPCGGMRRRALLYRPDILSALSAYEASQSDLQIQIARQYPDIHLGPGFEYDQGANKWRLGFSIPLPVFNQNQGAIAEAEARRREMAARFTALQASVIGEIDLALAGYAKAYETLEAAGTLLAAQKERERSVRARLAAGEDDRLALLSAKLQVYSAVFSRLDALYRAQQALGLLEDALWQPLGLAQQ